GVEAAMAFDEGGDGRGALGPVGDVALQQHRHTARGFHGGGGLVGLRRGAHSQADDRTSGPARLRHTLAHTGRGAGDEHHAALHRHARTRDRGALRRWERRAHGSITVPRSATSRAPVSAPPASDPSRSTRPATSATADPGASAATPSWATAGTA